MLAREACVRSWVILVQWFFLVPLARTYPTTTPVSAVTHEQVPCAPLTRGPCAANEWIVLDGDPTSAGDRPPLPSRCAPRPCPDGQFPSQGSCLSEAEARQAQCGGGAVHLDPAGRLRCGDPQRTAALAAAVRCPMSVETTTVVGAGPVKCAQTNSGDCIKVVVDPVTPGVVIQPED